MLRNRIASKFGKLEHLTGKLFVAFSIYVWYTNKTTNHLILMVLAIVYLLSHTLEKKFYGNKGPRG